MAMLNINDGIKEFRKNKNAVLLDVRTKKEYNYGNIKGSVNIPVQLLERVSRQIVDKDTPIYVYCHSGIRSARSVQALKDMGYNKVTDIGGIKDYIDN